MYGIIMAGGGGSRLWPHSRAATPKQLLALGSDSTLIQETVARLLPLIPADHLVVVTGAAHAAAVRAQLPAVPTENVIVEPSARGTAPAIGLALLHVARLAHARGEDDPVIGSFHADHIITDTAEFQAVVRDAAAVAPSGFIVTLGITPDRPHTGYGYIERGEALPSPSGRAVYRVARFVEKPGPAVAEEYLATGLYSWNSGMFIWQLSTIQAEYAEHLPELWQQLRQVAVAGAEGATVLQRVWPEITPMTIDVGIAERSSRMAVIPTDFGWSDVGDWAAVADLLGEQGRDGDGNTGVGPHLSVGTRDSLIFGTVPGKLIATIGLANIAIVDTGDALLVCDLSKNQDVKRVVEELKARGLGQYL